MSETNTRYQLNVTFPLQIYLLLFNVHTNCIIFICQQRIDMLTSIHRKYILSIEYYLSSDVQFYQVTAQSI